MVPRVKTNAGARAYQFCTPPLWNNFLLSVRSAASVATFRKHPKTHLFDLAPPPTFPQTPARPMAPLTLWKCFIHFAVEHWFDCRTTESGFAGDIGAIANWLIDWFIILFSKSYSSRTTLSPHLLIPPVNTVAPTYIWIENQKSAASPTNHIQIQTVENINTDSGHIAFGGFSGYRIWL